MKKPLLAVFASATLLLMTTPAFADEAPEPPKSTSKCSGGDAGELGALLALATITIAARRRRVQ